MAAFPAARDIDRALGPAHAHHHAAPQRHQRQHVAGHHDIVRNVFGRNHRDRAGPIGGGDTGGNALARLDQRTPCSVTFAPVDATVGMAISCIRLSATRPTPCRARGAP